MTWPGAERSPVARARETAGEPVVSGAWAAALALTTAWDGGACAAAGSGSDKTIPVGSPVVRMNPQIIDRRVRVFRAARSPR